MALNDDRTQEELSRFLQEVQVESAFLDSQEISMGRFSHDYDAGCRDLLKVWGFTLVIIRHDDFAGNDFCLSSSACFFTVSVRILALYWSTA